MKIVFDMDNTLVDELGASLRPGICRFLEKLKKEGHTLILWTNSTRQRARTIMHEKKLTGYFSSCIFREDYDPGNRGKRKDIRKIGGDFLIDDNPAEINFLKSLKIRGFRITPYRKGARVPSGELEKVYKAIKKADSFWNRLLG